MNRGRRLEKVGTGLARRRETGKVRAGSSEGRRGTAAGRLWRLGRPLLALLAAAGAVLAQEPRTRTALIEAERAEKSRRLKPETVDKWEARLRAIKEKKVIERFTYGLYGFRARLGGAATGQGFAIGPEWIRRDLFNGAAILLANYQLTFTGGARGELAFELPRSPRKRYWARGGLYRKNYNRVDYYGPGPGSAKTGRSNYRYEDFSADGVFGLRFGGLEFGPSAGLLRVNIGPGRGDDSPSTDEIYGPGQAPGIDRQTRFGRMGWYLLYDWRDSPLGPRAGGLYGAEYSYYDDRELNRHDFHLFRLEIQQYFPFFNKRRIIALGARTDLTWTAPGQQVPFYFQPVVGGSEDLRGFRPYRFYGDNSMVMNLEYRWEVFAGMDAALFADAGKVFDDKAQLNFANLETDVGFGLRFNVRNATFLRIDVGFSHEGVQVWVKFNDLFVKKPVGRSSPKHVF